ESQGQGQAKITDQYQIEGKELQISYTVKKSEASNFFDVMIDNELVGKGYCAKAAKAKKVAKRKSLTCHLEYQYQGIALESTLHAMGRKLYRIGSVVDTEGKRMMYS